VGYDLSPFGLTAAGVSVHTACAVGYDLSPFGLTAAGVSVLPRAGCPSHLIPSRAPRRVGPRTAIGVKISPISGAGWRGRPRTQGREPSRPSKSRLDSRLCKPGGLRHGVGIGLILTPMPAPRCGRLAHAMRPRATIARRPWEAGP
jgi:hypothetical protein